MASTRDAVRTALLLVALSFPGGSFLCAQEEERADILFTRGILALDDGNYARAEDYFSQVHRLRPGDVPTLFFLGLARNRLGEYGAAVRLLEDVAGRDPRYPGVALERGYARAGLGMCREAIPLLEDAMREEPQSGFACYLMGVCLAGTGEDLSALGYLSRAEALAPELGAPAAYQSAASLVKLGRDEEARRNLLRIIREEPEESRVSRAARELLARLEGRPAPKRVWVDATARYEYDSNVTLLPDNEALVDTSEKGDWRFMNTFQLKVSPVVRPRYDLSIYYRFLDSVHNHIGDFNLQGHELAPTFTVTLGRVNLFAGYEFDYYFLDDCHQSYYRTNGIFAGTDFQLSPHSLTRLQYRYTTGDYFLDFTAPEDNLDIRGANTVGFDHYLFLGGRADCYCRFAFSYDRNNTAGRNFTYNGYDFIWEFCAPLFQEVRLDAWARYLILDFPRSTTGRRDHRQEYNVMLLRPLNECFDVALNYGATINDSTVPLYQFDRNIYSLILACHF
jgi:tetratricopeptide (TPR) repeat protein